MLRRWTKLQQLIAGEAPWGVAAIKVYEVLCRGSEPSDWQDFFRDVFSACDVLAITEDVALAAAAVNRTFATPSRRVELKVDSGVAVAGARTLNADELGSPPRT